MYRWKPCPGSVRLSANIESKSSSYADEGSKAHEVAAALLEGQGLFDVDSEMLSAVQVYVDEVNQAQGQRLIEHRLDLSKIYPGLYGTCDAVVFNAQNGLLSVFDYKHGAGIPVEVVEAEGPNLQLSYYALGALVTCGFLAREIEIVIVQPRCPHPDGSVRRHKIDLSYMLDFADDLITSAKATEDPNAPLVPGEHCRFCPAAATCPEIHKNALELAKQEFQPAFSYEPKSLAKTLEWLPVLESWCKNVREFAYREAEHGRCPPGWKLVQKRANRKWKHSEDEIASNLECILPDQECYWDKSLKSPAQVEKLLGKGAKEILADLITQESGGLTLAPESDRRPAAQITALEAFKNVQTISGD